MTSRRSRRQYRAAGPVTVRFDFTSIGTSGESSRSFDALSHACHSAYWIDGVLLQRGPAPRTPPECSRSGTTRPAAAAEATRRSRGGAALHVERIDRLSQSRRRLPNPVHDLAMTGAQRPLQPLQQTAGCKPRTAAGAGRRTAESSPPHDSFPPAPSANAETPPEARQVDRNKQIQLRIRNRQRSFDSRQRPRLHERYPPPPPRTAPGPDATRRSAASVPRPAACSSMCSIKVRPSSIRRALSRPMRVLCPPARTNAFTRSLHRPWL